MSCKDNKDGSCTVEYIPFTAGDYDVNITFGGHPIPGVWWGWGSWGALVPTGGSVGWRQVTGCWQVEVPSVQPLVTLWLCWPCVHPVDLQARGLVPMPC